MAEPHSYWTPDSDACQCCEYEPDAENDVAIAEQMLPAGLEVLPPYDTDVTP